MRDLYVGLWVVGVHPTRRVLRLVFWPHVCALKTPSILLSLFDVALATIGVRFTSHKGTIYTTSSRRLSLLMYGALAVTTLGLEHGAV